MSFRRYISAVLAVTVVGLASLVVFAQDATPTPDAAMDSMAMATMDPMQGGMMSEGAMAPIIDASGAQVGWAMFSPSMAMTTGMGMSTPDATMMTGSGKVLVTVQLQSATLTPGFHGMHLHMMGSCGDTGEGPFTAAGEHIPMGPLHPDHVGDFPSALVNMDGTAYVSFETDRFTMADLLDADGTAILLHANPDNHSNIPERYGVPDQETLMTGDAGARIACGVLQAGVAGAMDPMMPADPAAVPTPTS